MDLSEKVKAARAEKGLRDTSASDLVANLMQFGSDWIGAEPARGGTFTISAGAELVEPKGNA